MADPRIVPGYKQKHHAERVELLLGAILDELVKANAAADPIPGETPPTPPGAEAALRRLSIGRKPK